MACARSSRGTEVVYSQMMPMLLKACPDDTATAFRAVRGVPVPFLPLRKSCTLEKHSSMQCSLSMGAIDYFRLFVENENLKNV